MNALVHMGAADAPADVGGGTRQHLTFMLGEEMFAIAIGSIREIIEFGRLTAVPMMPGFIRGVINLRGAVVPVVDLGSRFGGPCSEITRRTCIVILEIEVGTRGDDVMDAQVIGIVVDTVNEVVDIAESDIEPAPTFGTHVRSEFLSGMGRRGEGFVLILDVDKVLSIDELVHLGDTLPELAVDP